MDLADHSAISIGTSGLGRASVRGLAKHTPAHIYFTGRNLQAAQELIQEVQRENPLVQMTFIKMDMTSLVAIKKACREFVGDRLDVLM
jgi:NAD(P)-dependent dehydrogenase (short-subunit alcohol dehydrogenase family)